MNPALFNATTFLLTVGYLGLFCLVFAETGLLIGLVLPGRGDARVHCRILELARGFQYRRRHSDHLLRRGPRGQHRIRVRQKYGAKVFNEKKSLFFDKEYVDAAEDFYKKHGGKTILIARFLPFVRTVAPWFAGVGKMHYRLFLAYNAVGALVWAVVISLLGYFRGKAIPNADQYAWWIVLAIAVASAIPPLVALLTSKERRHRLATFIKERVGFHKKSQ